MRLLVYLMLAILVTPLQMTLLDEIAIYGIKPDLALLATYAVALVYGEADGVGLGVLLGWTQDLFAGTVMGVHLVPLAIAGLIAGIMGRAIINLTFLFSIGGLFFVTLAQLLVRNVLFDGWIGLPYFLSTVWHLTVPVAIVNCAAGAIVYTLWDRWEKRTEARERGALR